MDSNEDRLGRVMRYGVLIAGVLLLAAGVLVPAPAGLGAAGIAEMVRAGFLIDLLGLAAIPASVALALWMFS